MTVAAWVATPSVKQNYLVVGKAIVSLLQSFYIKIQSCCYGYSNAFPPFPFFSSLTCSYVYIPNPEVSDNGNLS